MKSIAIAAAILAATVSTGASAATIVSANFESGFGAFTPTGAVGIANGATYAACCFTNPAYTDHFVAFGGGNVPSGTISTTFATVVGATYTVAFDYGALGGGVDPLVVTAGLVPHIYTPSANNDLFSTFTTASFTFVGTGVDTLSIYSGGINNVDAIVDNVSVSGAAVPEPATWGLMILGFGSLGAVLRRRKTVAAFA